MSANKKDDDHFDGESFEIEESTPVMPVQRNKPKDGPQLA